MPPILPKSPFRPLYRQRDPLPHPLSWTADGQGSRMTKSFLGSALARSPGCPSPGWCKLFPVLPSWCPAPAAAVGCWMSRRAPLTHGTWLALVPPCHRPCSSSQGSLLPGLRGAVSWGWFAFLTKTSRCWCYLPAITSDSVQACENSRLRLLLLIEYNTEIIHP